MSVNKHPTNHEWYQVRHRPNGAKGKVEVITVKKGGIEQARQLDKIFKSAPKKRNRGVEAYPIISDEIENYIKFYSLEHLDTTNIKRSLYRWCNYVGKLFFNNVNVSHVENYKHDRIEEGIKPITINKEVGALAGLIKWGASKGYCQQPNFFTYFPAKKTKSPLPDVPTREEVLALIHSMIWPKCGLFACLYFAGLRANESRLLTVEDIHLEQRYMIVTGKGNKERPVPIVDELYPWIEKRLTEIETGYLWTTRNGKPIDDLKRIIYLAKERAGIKRRMYPHLLRHAFGTHSTMSGVGIRSLQYAMGHTTSTTTEIYTTLSNSAVIQEITQKFGKGGK